MFIGLSKKLHMCLHLAMSTKAPSALIKQTQNLLGQWWDEIIIVMLYSQYCLGACSHQVQLPTGLLQATHCPKCFKALDLTATCELRNCYSSPTSKGLKHREIKDWSHCKLGIVWYSHLGFPNSYYKKLALPEGNSSHCLKHLRVTMNVFRKSPSLHWLLRQET